MDKSIEVLAEKYSGKFPQWVETINDFNNSFNTLISNQENEKIIMNTARVFSEMLEIFIKHGNFKDTWDKTMLFFTPFILQVEKKSLKTDFSFELGLDINGIFLQTHIRYPENLKHMSDEFWLNFLELSKYGQFEFKENETFGIKTKREFPHLFQTFKGNLFKITRNYFAAEFISKDHIDLGWLVMTWSTEKYGMSEIFMNGCKTLKILYNLNYSLWKINVLKNKKKVK